MMMKWVRRCIFSCLCLNVLEKITQASSKKKNEVNKIKFTKMNTCVMCILCSTYGNERSAYAMSMNVSKLSSLCTSYVRFIYKSMKRSHATRTNIHSVCVCVLLCAYMQYTFTHVHSFELHSKFWNWNIDSHIQTNQLRWQVGHSRV